MTGSHRTNRLPTLGKRIGLVPAEAGTRPSRVGSYPANPGLHAAEPESLGDYDDLFGLLSPVALRDLELNTLTLFEGPVSVGLDR